ncbi:unnamed protein product [Lepeophtheirus salmonis]|uniref:(salmon louse) hypothetical protein n=1 Tax=Lepeophtheirus salmonis TaxID=72036 RepID=A0A7R8D756_LEPSM|nr:unnamed protein product [Lepeophtheirus salmonis]CAF3045593.1 unnamed protein product [Lepeophtheirus salmonis]
MIWLLKILLILLLFSGSQSQIKINGGWTRWSHIISTCIDKTDLQKTVYCGGGIQTKYRSCNNPEPANGGSNCEGEAQVQTPCNIHMCQLSKDKTWSEWGSCSVSCGKGIRKRVRMCGSFRSKVGSEEEIQFKEKCHSHQYNEIVEECDSWDISSCPSPCLKHTCPEFAVCVDNSTQENRAKVYCVCQLGTVMKDDGTSCIDPSPSHFELGINSFEDNMDKITWISRLSSIIVITLLLILLVVFFVRNVFDSARVIQMNMEIALLCANVLILPGFVESEGICKFLSIGNHLFYTAAFIFMLLESIQFYSLLAWVVPRNGLLKSSQNVCIGWCSSGLIIIFTICFEYDNYGGSYHCWLRMEKNIAYAAYFPIFILFFLTIIIIEASGSSDSYAPLSKIDEDQRDSAKFMRKSLFLILILVTAAYIFGSLANFHQNIVLSGLFCCSNILMGIAILILHGLNNSAMRNKFSKLTTKVDPLPLK